MVEAQIRCRRRDGTMPSGFALFGRRFLRCRGVFGPVVREDVVLVLGGKQSRQNSIKHASNPRFEASSRAVEPSYFNLGEL